MQTGLLICPYGSIHGMYIHLCTLGIKPVSGQLSINLYMLNININILYMNF